MRKIQIKADEKWSGPKWYASRANPRKPVPSSSSNPLPLPLLLLLDDLGLFHKPGLEEKGTSATWLLLSNESPETWSHHNAVHSGKMSSSMWDSWEEGMSDRWPQGTWKKGLDSWTLGQGLPNQTLKVTTLARPHHEKRGEMCPQGSWNVLRR